MMPNRPRPEEPARSAEGLVMAPRPARPAYHWYHKVWAVLLVSFCLEIGLFLLIFPWTVYWYNGYVRGAVSGLGALDLYIALLEIFRLRRFARRRQP